MNAVALRPLTGALLETKARMAVVGPPDNAATLQTTTLKTLAPAPVTTADDERLPAWSPDGLQLGFVRTVKVVPSGSEGRPDGTKIGILIVKRTGGTRTVLGVKQPRIKVVAKVPLGTAKKRDDDLEVDPPDGPGVTLGVTPEVAAGQVREARRHVRATS